jgi:anti-sigma regulatory factor (Ser/Thr protein kinase)
VTQNERRQRARGAELRFNIPPDPRLGGQVRRRLVAFAQSEGVAEADICDFMGAVGEALANAIEHAHTQKPIEIAAWLLDDRLFASVRDQGVGFVPSERTVTKKLPDALAERGRGLPIMRRFADVFSVRSVPGEGTSVTLGCHVSHVAGHQVHHCA